MASPVDISNIALSLIGAEALVSAIDPPDGSREAGLCAQFWPLVRAEVLDEFGFAFSLTRVALAEVTNDSIVWLYAYALPSGMVSAKRVLSLQYITAASLVSPLDVPFVLQQNVAVIDNLFTERGSSDFEIEGDVLRTNEPAAVLKYSRDVTDTTKYPPLCVSAMGMLLASYLAGPIIKGVDGMKVGAQWRQSAYAMIDKASASDANSSSERVDHVAEMVRARL